MHVLGMALLVYMALHVHSLMSSSVALHERDHHNQPNVTVHRYLMGSRGRVEFLGRVDPVPRPSTLSNGQPTRFIRMEASIVYQVINTTCIVFTLQLYITVLYMALAD